MQKYPKGTSKRANRIVLGGICGIIHREYFVRIPGGIFGSILRVISRNIFKDILEESSKRNFGVTPGLNLKKCWISYRRNLKRMFWRYLEKPLEEFLMDLLKSIAEML